MKYVKWIFLSLILLLIIMGLAKLWARQDSKVSISIDVFTCFVLSITGFLIWGQLREASRNNRFMVSEKKRDDFVKFKNIRMLIEHNNIELQTMIAILNTARPYDPMTLPPEYQNLHEEFDRYLDYLEGVAILYEYGDISDESWRSLWKYNFKRLREVCIADGQPPSTSREKQKVTEYAKTYIYGGSVPANVEEAWERHEAFDPFEDPVDKTGIFPVTRPIWHYINTAEYIYNSIKVAVQKAYMKIDVTTPDKGEVWEIGSNQTIKWRSLGLTGTEKVKIELSRDGGVKWRPIVKWGPIVPTWPNTGSKGWKVTGPATTYAMIRVSSVTNQLVSDESSVYFTIPGPPTVTTSTASTVTANTATLNGNLTNLGSVTMVTLSFLWGTSQTALTDETKPFPVRMIGPFSHKLTGLTPSTTYYFKAKALGSGTANGNLKSFKTPP